MKGNSMNKILLRMYNPSILFILLNHTNDYVNVTVKNLDSGIKTSYIVQSNYSGYFTIDNILTGSYNILVKSRYYLANKNDSISLASGNNNFNFGVAGYGDLNNDNKVNFLGIGPFSACYGSSSPSCSKADANGDGTVNFLDIGPFSANYGSVGASGV